MKRPKGELTRQTSTGLPLPVGGKLFKRNQGNFWCFIPAVVQVTYTAARFWEGSTRCLVDGWVCLDAVIVYEYEAFLVVGGLGPSISTGDKRFVTPYVLRLIAISSKPGWLEGDAKVRRHEAKKIAKINESQRTPWSEKLDSKVCWFKVGGLYCVITCTVVTVT